MSNCTNSQFQCHTANTSDLYDGQKHNERSLRKFLRDKANRSEEEKSLGADGARRMRGVAVKVELLFIQLFRASDSKDYQRTSEMQTMRKAMKLPCLIDLMQICGVV